jgi:hypothetical protein
MSDQPSVSAPTTAAVVEQCQQALAHAWMVRTFVKHSDEAEQFPELMQVVRTVFDTSRALETRVSDPAGYLRMLQKKLGKLRRASEQFAQDAPQASTHTNFVQAVISLRAAVASLERLLQEGLAVVGTTVSHAPVARESGTMEEPADG